MKATRNVYPQNRWNYNLRFQNKLPFSLLIKKLIN